MSVPGMHLTPLGTGQVLLEPGEGLDPSEPEGYLEPLLSFMQEHRSRRLIYDLKDVAVVDGLYYRWLVRLNSLCQVANMDMVVVNMHPAAAFALAQEMDGSPPFRCALDVDRGRHLKAAP